MKAQVSSSSEAQTFALGQRLGRVLRPGDFVGLVGQLGAGKTQFSRGVADGAGISLDEVSSPTYSLIQTYRGRLTLHHIDLYRLATEADLFSIGYFELIEDDAAMLVEWVDRVPSASPADALILSLTVGADGARSLSAEASGLRAANLLAQWLAANADHEKPPSG